MVSVEKIVTCSNSKEELAAALKRINRELLEMKKKKTYNRSYEDYLKYSNLQRLQQHAIIEQEKRKSHL